MQHDTRLEPITVDDVIAASALDKYREWEITAGEWVEKRLDEVMQVGRGQFAAHLFVSLWLHVEQNKLGAIYTENTTFVLQLDGNVVQTMRKPDLAFVTAARVQHSENRCYLQAPDLVVEIVPPYEHVGALRARLRDYFVAGTQQMWLVYLDTQEIDVYQFARRSITYRVGDILPCGDLMPGFALDVESLFDL
jgi:Uma2 family endonuclease